MTPMGSASLPLIIVALGLVAVILSFMVPDRKKSLISLGLAGLIILAGIVELSSQSITRYRWNRRMKEIQEEQRINLEELRKKMQDKQSEAAPSNPAKKN